MYPVDPLTYKDRLAALGGKAEVAAVLRRIPAAAELVEGRGPLQHPFRPRQITSISELATYLASDPGIRLSIYHTNRIEMQLLVVACYRGGLITRDQAIADTGASPDVLDAAAAGLSELLLIDPSAGWVGARPGVAERVPMPGRLVRPGLDHVVSRNVEIILSNLGIGAGTRKWERVDALETALRDRATVENALASFEPTTVEMFWQIAKVGETSIGKLVGTDARAYSLRRNALQELFSTGLVGLDTYAGKAWVWLDVLVALNGGLFTDWEPTEPQLVGSTAHHMATTVPGVVGIFDRVVAHHAANPAPALATGGIGTNAVRAAAKILELPSPVVGLLTGLAVELGLLVPVTVETPGRGRSRQVTEEWRVTAELDDWKATPAVERWRRLVATWLSSPHLPTQAKPIERYDLRVDDVEAPLVRGLFSRALTEIPPGHGIPAGSLSAWLEYRWPYLVTPGSVPHRVAEARTLGFVEESDPVSLTPLAGHLLAGDDLAAAVAGGPDTFVVQADHTVIAPPDLDPDVASTLQRLAFLESAAGARIYRIDERSVVSALDGGLGADDILLFLDTHATAEVPSNVARTIRDVADRHGRLQVGSATTWVACDDPAVIAQAIAVKAAKLTAVSPTTAVSDLARSKVMAALRTAGLVATDSGKTDDDVVRAGFRPSTAASRSVRPAFHPDELARMLVEAPAELPRLADPGPHPPGRRHHVTDELWDTL